MKEEKNIKVDDHLMMGDRITKVAYHDKFFPFVRKHGREFRRKMILNDDQHLRSKRQEKVFASLVNSPTKPDTLTELSLLCGSVEIRVYFCDCFRCLSCFEE